MNKPTALIGQALRAEHAKAPDWEVVNEHHITRLFKFPDFQKALDFVNKVGAIAEAQGHHPDILLTWGKAQITVYTHSIDGLSAGDFTLAETIDHLLSPFGGSSS
jgi:4a-hydroxytetrahydrobiopterin dehydratase